MQVTRAEWDRIKALFEEAIFLEPAARQGYLRKVCPEDNLRNIVKRLVTSHDQSGDFLASSPWTPTTHLFPGHAFAAGDRLADRFEINRMIAQGGMGEVYEATDIELRDRVAIKAIRPALLLEPHALEKFKREVLLAKQVTHPNVCRIFDLFRHHDSTGEETYFVSMELLTGETLAERLKRTQHMTTGEALPIVLQVAVALQAAHEAGIVHRDLKPGNIVLVPTQVSPGIRAVVTDFGLAVSALDHAQTGSDGGASLSFGTPAYMSPEHMEGQELRPASDIYSLGIVMYEMVTGTRPFPTETAELGALKRLREEPTAPRGLIPDLDQGWETAIMKSLERDPARRYASAADLVKALQPGSFSGPVQDSVSRRIPLLRTAGFWIGAVVASLVVFVISYYYWFWVRPHQKHTFASGDAIVIADFDNTTGNALFDGTLRQALHDNLQQSPFFNLMPEYKIRSGMRNLGRSPAERLTRQTALQVCVLEKGRQRLAGTISLVAGQYRIALEMTDCWTGETMGMGQVDVDDRESVLNALGRATHFLRKQLREPSSLQRFEVSISQSTSGSLESIKAYASAVATWNTRGGSAALPLFRRAVELDPNYAMAYAQMGTVYGNLGQEREAHEALTKALEKSSQVAEWEKFYITSHYHAFVTGNLEKEIETYEQWRQTYPSEPTWRINLGLDYALKGLYEQAVPLEREAIMQSPELAPPYANLAAYYLALNRLDDAQATLREAAGQKLDDFSLRTDSYQLAFLRGDATALERQVSDAQGKLGFEDGLLATHSDTAAFHGQVRKSRELSRRAVASANKAGTPETAASYIANHAVWEAHLGYAKIAVSDAQTALRMASGKDVQVAAALAFARAGRPSGAEDLARRLQKAYPEDTLVQSVWLPSIRAEVALQRRDLVRALDIPQSAIPYETGAQTPFQCMYPVYVRAEAFLAAHRGEAAVNEFRKIAEHPGIVANCPLGALAHLGLARSLKAVGRFSDSRAAYQEFLTIWGDADPDVPIIRDARREFDALP